MLTKNLRTAFVVAIALFAIALLASSATAQMNKPDMVTLKGTIIDLTCAAKGKALMDSWHNADNNDHKTPEGLKENCATMCLNGGQPAALFAENEIQAVFVCNPQHTLANYAAQSAEVQGWWAGGENVKTFVPVKIRQGSGEWQDVNCAIMHQ